MIKFVIISFAFLCVFHAASKEDYLNMEALISRLARQMMGDSPKTAMSHMFSNVTAEDLKDLRMRFRNLTDVAMDFFEYTEKKVIEIMSKPKDEISWKNLGDVPRPPEQYSRTFHRLLIRCYVTTVKLFLFGLKSGDSLGETCDPYTTDLDTFFGCVMEKAEKMSEMKSEQEFRIMEGFDTDPNHPFHVPRCDVFEDVCSMNPPSRVTACEGQHITINCQYGTIAVKDANFRDAKDSDVCPYWQGHSNSIDCTPAPSKNKAVTECDGKPSCTLKSSTDVFGDPCYDNQKVLSVEYCCSLRDFADMRDAIFGHLTCTRKVVSTLIKHVVEDIENEIHETNSIELLMRNTTRRLAIAEMSTNIFEEVVDPLRRLSESIGDGRMKPMPFARRHLKSLLEELRALTKKDTIEP